MNNIRGVWLTNVDTQVFNSKASLTEVLTLIADTGFNVVFPVVWNKGFTLYPSQVMASTFGKAWTIAPPYLEDNRDPLAEIINTAQKLNLKVIPWFEYGFAYTHNSLQNKYRVELEQQLKQKNWLGKTPRGKLLIKNGFCWLNALSPSVQDFMLNLLLEVVQNYPVDGIQGDDRLPAFPSEGGYHFWSTKQKRANILTNFLARLYSRVKEINPELIVSVAPHPFGFGYREYLQDVPKWLDLGIVDVIHPQLYRRDFCAYQQLLQETVRQLNSTQLTQLFPGVLLKIGNYRLEAKILEQLIDLHRDLGISGEVFFFHEGIRENNGELAKVLQRKY